jgi:hypothetical protein
MSDAVWNQTQMQLADGGCVLVIDVTDGWQPFASFPVPSSWLLYTVAVL